MLVLTIAKGAPEDGPAQGTDPCTFGSFAALVVADHAADDGAPHCAGRRAAFGVVHGAGTADEHAGSESEDDEFVFHIITVFKG